MNIQFDDENSTTVLFILLFVIVTHVLYSYYNKWSKQQQRYDYDYDYDYDCNDKNEYFGDKVITTVGNNGSIPCDVYCATN